MALPNLPEDIIQTKILTLLPIKSLMRFRSVCKSWKSLFYDPGFAKYHLSCTTQNPDDDDNLIISKFVTGSLKRKHNDIDACNYYDLAIVSRSNLSETKLFDVPRSKRATNARINLLSDPIHLLGSINGLVCLYVTKLRNFVLWNPAIRQAKKFNVPRWYDVGFWSPGDFFGFCWDELENDFQVVICYVDKHTNGVYPLRGHSACQGRLSFSSHVYSCNSGSWSSKDITLPGLNRWPGGHPSAIVNGLPYWNYYSSSEQKPSVIKFEVQSNEFRVLPEFNYGVRYQHKYVIVNWKECLSVLMCKPRSEKIFVDVYIFDERNGIWSKMFAVGPIRIPVHTLSGCFKCGGEIVFNYTNEEYMCYDHTTKKIERFGNREGRLIGGFSYKATLVFLQGMKPLHKVQPIFWN